jgi:hypothetical protein
VAVVAVLVVVAVAELEFAELGLVELGLVEVGLVELEFVELAELEPAVDELDELAPGAAGVVAGLVAGACVGVCDCAGWLVDGAGDVGVWVGVPGEDDATSAGTQLLLVAGLAARDAGAALAMPWVPSTSRTPPLTTPAAIARMCTKHMKDRPVCPARQALMSGRPEVAGFGTTVSYPLLRQLYLWFARGEVAVESGRVT